MGCGRSASGLTFLNAPPGLVFPGDPQYACGKSLNCPQSDKFLPRLGLVWDPLGDGKTTVTESAPFV
jgi:hypothetical protein